MVEKDYPSKDLVEIYAEKLKVCGHPLRLKILCLIDKQDSSVSGLWQCLEQPQPVISQHLAVLKNKGIVESLISGNKRIYRISDDFVRGMIERF